MNLSRRSFLKGLGTGVAIAAAPAILLPERKIWQVPANAPVRNGTIFTSELLATFRDTLDEVIDGRGNTISSVRRVFIERHSLEQYLGLGYRVNPMVDGPRGMICMEMSQAEFVEMETKQQRLADASDPNIPPDERREILELEKALDKSMVDRALWSPGRCALVLSVESL